jgi:hypothetical protein
MSEDSTPADLLDLKMMPAWVNEPARTNDYADHPGEDERSFDRERRGPRPGRDSRPRGPRPGGPREQREGGRGPGGRRPEGRRPDQQRRPEGGRPDRRPEHRERREAPAPLPQVSVRFIPHAAALESVINQIKSNAVTYSVFALARLFLDKPERYDVRLAAAEGAVLHQLGENGPVAVDPRTLETSAFAAMRDEFYTVEETQSEPLKGNFVNVARDRISGTLLGPTNHHNYQPQLRSLYEQRYSRRMSFQDFQRQIEIVSDPAIVEQWKEQARAVTTYTTKGIEPPVTFNNAAEAERHFRQMHLPVLLRSAPELTISGVVSRRLQDRGLGRLIEDAWSAEIRSPSKMMAELAGALRGAGLNIFRHRRGMLFVSPIRIRTFGHERTGVSVSINSILEKLTETPGLTRKQLAEKLVPEGGDTAAADRVKLSLGSDLRWLISEGYLIEFNDGTLDLPRAKPPGGAGLEAKQAPKSAAVAAESEQANAIAGATETEPTSAAETPTAMTDGMSVGGEDAGGMSIEQSNAPTESPADAEPVSETAEAAALETETPQSTEPQAAPREEEMREGAVPSPS